MFTRFPFVRTTYAYFGWTVALCLGVLLILEPGDARNQAPQLAQEWEVTEGLERPESVA